MTRPGERLADRTNLGPDRAGPDDVALPGIACPACGDPEGPCDEVCADPDCDYPWDCCCHDACEDPIDLDHLAVLLEPSWITVTPRAEFL